MRTYYKHKALENVYYRTQSHTTQLQARYRQDADWQRSLRYTDSSNAMEPLVEIPMTEVPYLSIAKIHKTFKTLFCVLLTLVLTLVVIVAANPIN
jgi:hypothetical protein